MSRVLFVAASLAVAVLVGTFVAFGLDSSEAERRSGSSLTSSLPIEKGLDELSAYCEDLVERVATGDLDAYDSLAELLVAEGRIARAAARRAIAGAADRESWVPLLVKAATQAEGDLRLAGLIALGALGVESKEATFALLSALRDPDPQVRLIALVAMVDLAESGTLGFQALDPLLAAASDDVLDNRVLATRVVGLVGRGSTELVGDKSVRFLERQLGSNDPEVRIEAASALAEIGPSVSSAIPTLSRMIIEPDDRVSLAAANSLGRAIAAGSELPRGVQAAYQDVLQAARSPVLVRRVLEHLCTLAPESESVRELIDQATTSDEEVVRQVAAEVVSRTTSKPCTRS